MESCRDGGSSGRFSGLIGGELLRPDWWRAAEMAVLVLSLQRNAGALPEGPSGSGSPP